MPINPSELNRLRTSTDAEARAAPAQPLPTAPNQALPTAPNQAQLKLLRQFAQHHLTADDAVEFARRFGNGNNDLLAAATLAKARQLAAAPKPRSNRQNPRLPTPANRPPYIPRNTDALATAIATCAVIAVIVIMWVWLS